MLAFITDTIHIGILIKIKIIVRVSFHRGYNYTALFSHSYSIMRFCVQII